MGKKLLKIIVLASIIIIALISLFGALRNGTFNRQANAQAIPVQRSDYDTNGNIKPGPAGTDTVWTPGVGWQYVAVNNGTTETGGTTNVAGFSPGTDHLPDGWTWTQDSTPCGSEQYCYIDATGHYQHGVPPTNEGTEGTDGSGGAYDFCSRKTNKPNNCTCTTEQAAACTSGYCNVTNGQSSGTCQTKPGINGGIPIRTLTCDPVADGVIDSNDFDVWKQEYLHEVSTTRSACLSPNRVVDLLGFQAWKNIAVLHTRQSF